MKQFTDQSTASRTEKAMRVLRALANPHDYKYFFGDGFPRHADLQQDAAAALEVLETLVEKVPNVQPLMDETGSLFQLGGVTVPNASGEPGLTEPGKD